MRRFGLLLQAMLLILSCRSPLHETDPDLATLRVRAAADSDVSRTVVPDFSSQLDELTVSLTSVDGYASPAPQTDTSAPWQVSFSVPPGSWNIAVVAKKAGIQVGAGSLSNITLKSGLMDPVTVSITFGAAAATGGVRFAVSVPDSTGIDYVHGLIEETFAELAPALTASGTRRSSVFEFSGLAGGTYSLVLTFKRGGATGTAAGVFREKLIVIAGLESGSWVGPDGGLLGERAFSESEFASPEASLAGLSIDGGVFAASSFSAATFTYDLGSIASLPSSVTFTATTSRSDQCLEYSWNEGAFTEIRSGTASPSLDTDDIQILKVRVTAPDRATKSTYRVTFTDALVEGSPYSYPVPGGAVETTLSGGEAAITGSSGCPTSLELPAYINGYPLTKINTRTLDGYGCLTTVVIPATVTYIGAYAFESCPNIQHIRFLRMTPPTLESGGLHTSAPEPEFYVPVGALAAYQAAAAVPASPWSNYGARLQEWPY